VKAENIIVKMKDEAYSILGSKNISVQFEHSSVNLDLKLSFEIRENLYFIFKELFNNKKWALLAAFFMVFSPHSLFFSRIALEPILANLLIIIGFLFAIKF